LPRDLLFEPAYPRIPATGAARDAARATGAASINHMQTTRNGDLLPPEHSPQAGMYEAQNSPP